MPHGPWPDPAPGLASRSASGRDSHGDAGVRMTTLTAVAVLLAGCGGLGGPGGDAPEGEAAAALETTATGDVLAPERFAFSGEGLWDGRPSLGGVWVAHPDVAEPGRVLIRRPEGGAEVTGALFRRQTEAAGPPLQVSSDAAAALGLVAGQPAALEVTAIRPPEAPEVPGAPDAEPDEALEPLDEVPGAPLP